MITRALAMVAVCAGFAAGCAATSAAMPSASRAPEATAEPAGQIRLTLARPVVAINTDLTVTLVAVESDSRCAKGETCIWEGSAAVRLNVAGGDGARKVVLHTSPAAGPNWAAHDGWTIELVALEPFPTAGRPIAQGDYVAIIAVARASSRPASDPASH